MNSNYSIERQRQFSRGSGKGTAALRAIETQKEDQALISDPYAHFMAGNEGFEWVDSLSESMRTFFIDMLAVRTRIFDDFCNDNLNYTFTDASTNPNHKIERTTSTLTQMVIMGAGYDTRPLRLNSIADKVVFEVDLNEVLLEKSRIITAHKIERLCKEHFLIPLDLRQCNLKQTLLKFGFNTRLPTIWLVEALTGYLSEKENHEMFKDISQLSEYGSCVLSTFIGESREAFGPGSGASKKHIFFTDNSTKIFTQNGWSSHQRKIFDYAKIYNREKNLLGYDYWITEARLIEKNEQPELGENNFN